MFPAQKEMKAREFFAMRTSRTANLPVRRIKVTDSAGLLLEDVTVEQNAGSLLIQGLGIILRVRLRSCRGPRSERGAKPLYPGLQGNLRPWTGRLWPELSGETSLDEAGTIERARVRTRKAAAIR